MRRRTINSQQRAYDFLFEFYLYNKFISNVNVTVETHKNTIYQLLPIYVCIWPVKDETRILFPIQL